MKYEVEIVKKADQNISVWSGGKTRELAIFPKDAVYSNRDFKWRLSTAIIEAEESDFTSLPNINRTIMILDGEITLLHEGHYKKVLKKHDQDSFSGGWTTKSYGKAVDFNLMMAEGFKGTLEAFYLNKGEVKCISFAEVQKESTVAIYCAKGAVDIKLAKIKGINLQEGDIALINIKESNEEAEPEVIGQSLQSEIIIATIC